MAQFYIDPSRETDEHALPNAEVFWSDGEIVDDGTLDPIVLGPGWYWWPCFPDGEPVGPFDTEEAAIQDARGES